MIPKKIRVSLGSAILLALTDGAMDSNPTTVYLLTYRAGRCIANCGFCSQARSSTSRADMLSRITWPVFCSKEVINRIASIKKGLIKRVCIQTMNYPNMFSEVLELVRRIHVKVDIPISVSCQPLTPDQIKKLGEAGVDKVSIPLDVPTETLFEKVKGSEVRGPYVWKRHIEALKAAVKILGKNKVSTHLIAGLGEKDEELILMIQRMVDIGVYPALFAFTPIPGTRLEGETQPQIERYRHIQLAHYLITVDKTRFEDIVFNEEGCIRGFTIDNDLLRETVKTGVPFMTSGCKGCNRPFFNERVGGIQYNFPRKLSKTEIDKIETLILGDV